MKAGAENNKHWKQFINIMIISLIACFICLSVFILIIDPYDSLPFSLKAQRAPMCSNQRFSFPMLAKRQEFDSAIIGTSTTRLLEPQNLNDKLNARFVNLSMDSASLTEQLELFHLFLKHHPHPKYIIFGIDYVWCNADNNVLQTSGRAFPSWMYHSSPWTHTFYMLNTNTVEQAFRQLGYLLGFKKARFGMDGYANFLPQDQEYDLSRAREYLYPDRAKTQPNKWLAMNTDYNDDAHYRPQIQNKSTTAVQSDVAITTLPTETSIKTLHYMQAILKQIPDDTKILFVFVPYHHHFQYQEGTCQGNMLKQCKSEFKKFISLKPNVHIFDFMIYSDITKKDENYWDPMHYNVAVAKRLMQDIKEGLEHEKSKKNEYWYYSSTAK